MKKKELSYSEREIYVSFTHGANVEMKQKEGEIYVDFGRPIDFQFQVSGLKNWATTRDNPKIVFKYT
jgi:hypothetical protein